MSIPYQDSSQKQRIQSVGRDGANSTRLSILLVNYNGIRYLVHCLEAIFQFAPPGTQVILEDNASTDGSLEIIETSFPQVEIVRSNRNLGFAGGNNLAGERANGKFVLLLNTDTLLLEPIAPAVDWLEEHPTWGALTINMVDGAHESAACTGRFPSPLRLALLRSMLVQPGQYQGASAYDVDWVQGSFLLMRRDLWNRLHGLDERYFLYAEDVDICKRIQRSGYKCGYLPHLRYLHWGGFEPKRFPDQISGLATYARIQLSRPQWLISWGILLVGCILRATVYYVNWRVGKRDVDFTKAMASRNAIRELIKRNPMRLII